MNLLPTDIHCWLCRPRQITDASLLARYTTLLNADERARQQRYRFAEHRHNSLVTRAFLRDRLAHYTRCPPQDLRFAVGEHGKPWLPDFPDLHFNLSHTDNLVVLAVTKQAPLGVDVEWLARRSDALAIADRYFSALETEALFALPVAQQRDRFFDYWTLKESYIKACGMGLAIPLRHFSFILEDEPTRTVRQAIRLAFAPERDDHPDRWCNWLFNLNPHYRLAISLNAPHGTAMQVTLQTGMPMVGFATLTLPMAEE